MAEPNRVWTADLTYVWTLQGWLYLAVVMDLYSRQIVGWAMDKRMKKQLVINALSMAFWRRKPPAGLLYHSDRGSQYACNDHQKLLRTWHMVPSMSRKADCWDNAPTERFFRSLKSERLDYCRFATRAAAKIEILDYITCYLNLARVGGFHLQGTEGRSHSALLQALHNTAVRSSIFTKRASSS